MVTAAERQLVLNCARQSMAPDLVHRTRELLQAPLGWDRIVRVAWQHGVASLLCKHVKMIDQEGAVPEEARRHLAQLYRRTAYRNLHLLSDLVDLLKDFARAGIKVILLKGPALVRHTYTDVASRPFRDLDLLIQQRDLGKARTLLFESGYRLQPDLLSEQFAQRYHFNVGFLKPGTVTTVLDLHWDFTDRYSGFTLDVEGFWARAQPVFLSNQAAFVLSREDLLTHLALHLDMHGHLNRALIGRGEETRFIFHPFSDNRLIWFTDLYEVISRHRGRIDWAALLGRSRRAGTDGPIAASLALLNVLFGPVVDSDVLERFEPPRSTYIKRKLVEWLMPNGAASGEGDGWIRTSVSSKLVKTRRGVEFRLIRLADLCDYILPSPGVVRRRMKGARRELLAFYYVIHVVEALGNCASRAAQFLFYLCKKKLAGGRIQLR